MDFCKTVEDRLAANLKNVNKDVEFLNELSGNEGPKENKVANHIVNKICKTCAGLNRDAIEFLLDELATADKNIKKLNYRDAPLSIEREETIDNGRVDIVISVGEEKIFIENKILAHDQGSQLSRYYNNSKKPFSLIYLTRFGRKASTESENGLKLGKDYFIASYYTHIYNWINKLRDNPLKNEQLEEDIRKFWNWLINQNRGFPDIYDYILSNKKEALDNIPTVEKCNDGFRHYVMWQRIIPELQEIANLNNLVLEVSDRFEFKKVNGYISFKSSTGKEIKFTCKRRSKKNCWRGINVNGNLISPCDWDFEALINYEVIIKSITTKIEEDFCINLKLPTSRQN